MTRLAGRIGRRAIGAVCLAALVASAIAGVANGATGDTFRVAAGGNLDWIPSGGATSQSSSEPLHVQDTLVGTNATAPYVLDAAPGAARAHLSGYYSYGIRFDPGVTTLAHTTLTVDGPAGQVSTALRLHVDGTMHSTCGLFARCYAQVLVYARVGGFELLTQVDRAGPVVNSMGLAIDTLSDGFHVHGDVTTPSFTVTTGQPFPVELEVRILTNAFPYEFSTFDVDFSDGITFAPTGPVLTLPAGYDASGSGVVGNRWIQGGPTAAFTVTPVNAGCGSTVQFDGSGSSAQPGRAIADYIWDFGDGSATESTSTPIVDHQFVRLGLLHPTLTVVDDLGVVSDPATTIARSLDTGAPTALLTGPATTAVGRSVVFDGSGSSDPEAGCGSRLVEWTWSLDGGSPIQTTGPTIDSTRFGSLASGPHTITLVVTDDSDNRSDPASFAFHVVAPPVAVVTATPTVAECGESVTFDGRGSTADQALSLVRWTWDPGDGAGLFVTTDPTFSHTYPRLGRFPASLVVRDEEGQDSAADTISIIVRDTGAPTADFSSPASMAAGQPVTFDGSASSDPEQGCGSRLVEWTWSLDGGSPIQTTGPTILSTAFAALLTPGTHTIGLVVTDDSDNRSAPVTRPIQVASAAGSIQLTVDTAPDSGTTITLAGPPALGTTQLDGSPATALPASKSFAGLSAGTYAVVQAPASGLALVRIACTDPDGGSVTNVVSGTASIDLDAGESIACTFTSVVTTNAAIAAGGLQSLGFTPAQATPILKGIGFTATQVGPALTTAFGITTSLATAHLRTAGYTPQEVMIALKNGFGLTAPLATSVFKVAAYPPADVAVALRDVFNRNAGQIAKLMKDALFSSNDTALGLRDGLGLLADAAVAAMRTGTFDSNAALGALMAVYSKTAELGAPILANAGYQLAQVTDALRQSGSLLIAQAAVVILPIAATTYATGDLAMSAVVGSLASAYAVGAPAIVPALQAAECTAAQVAVGLKLGLSLLAPDVALALKAYYAADDIAAALRDVFNRTPNQVAKLMKDAEYTANQVMRGLRYGLAQGEAAATAAMKFAGYEARFTLTQLMTVYSKTAELGAPILANAGYQLAQVTDALRQSGSLLIAQAAVVILPIAATTYATGDLAMSAVVGSLASAYAVGAPAIVPALQAAECTAAQVAVGLKLGLSLLAPDVALALKAYYAADDIAAALRDVFNRTPNQVAKLMKDAEYTANQVMRGLRYGLAQGEAAATAAMKFAGYEARFTLTQLMTVYSKTAELGAPILANAGYQLAQVTDALRQSGSLLIAQAAVVILPIAATTYATGDLAMSAVVGSLASAYAVGAPAIVPALQAAECTAAQVAVGLRLALGSAVSPEAMVAIKSAYALTRGEVTQLFRDAGYSSTAIARALHYGLQLGAALAAQLLFDVQYSIPTIGHRLADTLEAQPAEAAQILRDLQATSTEIGTSMRDDFEQDKHEVAHILDDLGYAPTTIAKRLKGLFSQDPAQVAAILHDDLEYDYSRIVDAMKGISQNATETVTILKGLGYHIDTLVRVLYYDFNKGVGSIQSILLGLNYSLPDILDSIASVLGL